MIIKSLKRDTFFHKLDFFFFLFLQYPFLKIGIEKRKKKRSPYIELFVSFFNCEKKKIQENTKILSQ